METSKYIEWIDTAKGIAIFFVLLLHSIPASIQTYIGAWWHIGQSVPIFLFCSSLLISHKYISYEFYYTKQRIIKMVKRIFVPFLILLACQIIVFFILGGGYSMKSLIVSGGIGPGSYYPWIYLQLWIIIPFIIQLTKKTPIWLSLICIIAISLLLESLFLFYGGSALYRLTIIRYLVVLWLGVAFVKFNSIQRLLFIVIGLFCGILAYLDKYVNLFNGYVPCYWSGYHWFTSLYLVLPIMLIQKIKMPLYVIIFLQTLGKYSYEIFLIQMFYFSFINIGQIEFISNVYIRGFIFVVTSVICILLLSYIYIKLIKQIKCHFLNLY